MPAASAARAGAKSGSSRCRSMEWWMRRSSAACPEVAPPGVVARRRGAPQQGEQQLREPRRHGLPLGGGQRVERRDRRAEAARQHAREAVRRQDQGGVERAADPPAAEGPLPRRQDQRPAIAVEGEARLAGSGQQREPARGDAAALPGVVEARARVERHEDQRHEDVRPAAPPREGGQRLRPGGEPRDRDAVGRPAQRRRGMGAPHRGGTPRPAARARRPNPAKPRGARRRGMTRW